MKQCAVAFLLGTFVSTVVASAQTISPPNIQKAFGALTIPMNGTTSLSFIITNPNASSLSGISFTDALPSGLAVSTPNGLNGSCGGGLIAANPADTSISLSGAALAGNDSCTFSVNVTGLAAGTLVNTTGVVSSNESGPGATASATVIVVAPPTVSQTFGAAAVPLNGTTSLSFTVSNTNAGQTLTGIAFSDTLPAGLQGGPPPGETGPCGGTITAVAGSGSVSLSGATLNANASCTFSVNVKGITAGDQVNTTTAISANESGAGPTSNTATLTVVAPPAITKTFGAAFLALNGTTTLSFTLTNPNATAALSGIGVTDALPSGLVLSTPSGLTGTWGGGTVTANEGGAR